MYIKAYICFWMINIQRYKSLFREQINKKNCFLYKLSLKYIWNRAKLSKEKSLNFIKTKKTVYAPGLYFLVTLLKTKTDLDVCLCLWPNPKSWGQFYEHCSPSNNLLGHWEMFLHYPVTQPKQFEVAQVIRKHISFNIIRTF